MEWVRTDIDVPERLAIVVVSRRDLVESGMGTDWLKDKDPVAIARDAEAFIERCRPDLKGVVVEAIRQNFHENAIDFRVVHPTFPVAMPGCKIDRIDINVMAWSEVPLVKPPAEGPYTPRRDRECNVGSQVKRTTHLKDTFLAFSTGEPYGSPEVGDRRERLLKATPFVSERDLNWKMIDTIAQHNVTVRLALMYGVKMHLSTEQTLVLAVFALAEAAAAAQDREVARMMKASEPQIIPKSEA